MLKGGVTLMLDLDLFERYIYSLVRTIITCMKSKVCIRSYSDLETFPKRNILSISDL